MPVELAVNHAHLREIAAGGKDAFYRGRAAEQIVETVRKEGGTLSMDDMAAKSAASALENEVLHSRMLMNHDAHRGEHRSDAMHLLELADVPHERPRDIDQILEDGEAKRQRLEAYFEAHPELSQKGYDAFEIERQCAGTAAGTPPLLF